MSKKAKTTTLAKAKEEQRALVARRTTEWVPTMTTEGELEELIEEGFLPDQEISSYRVPGGKCFRCQCQVKSLPSLLSISANLVASTGLVCSTPLLLSDSAVQPDPK